MAWGWRLPFLFSAVLLIVALYVRLNIAETPVFLAEKRNQPPAAPLRELFANHRRQVVTVAGALLGLFTFSFMAGTYLAGYAQTQLGHPRQLILEVGALGWFTTMVFVVLSATLCDKLGRRRTLLAGYAIALPWSFAVLPLIDTGSTALFAVAIIGTQSALGVMMGPLASFIPEIFATRYRYTGAGLAFNLAGIIGGAIPPLISGALLVAYGSWAIGLMMASLVLASLACTCLLPETKDSTLVTS